MCSSGDCLLRCANGERQTRCRQGKEKDSSKGCPKRSQGGKGHGGLQGRKGTCQTKSRRKESAQRLVDKFALDCAVGDDFDQVVADPRVDIVNLSGPNHVHTAQGIAAAKAGKHILMEKPMCLSMEENRALSDAVARAGVKSVVSFVLRWNPLVENLKSLLAGGAIGELFYVEVDYWHGLSDWWTGFEWASKRETGGSTMLTGGCHAVDALRWFAGDEVEEVTAFSNTHMYANDPYL